MTESTNRASRRRRRWIATLSLPGYVALVAFATGAWLQSSQFDPADSWMFVIMPVGVVSVLSWALAPFFFVIALAIFLVDLWRRERSRHEKAYLGLFVFGSPVAWFVSNLINDAYHLLR